MSLTWHGGRFADLAASRMPSGLTLPDALVSLFDWCQEQGAVSCHERKPDEPYAALSPVWPHPGTSIVFRVPPIEEQRPPWFGATQVAEPEPFVPFAQTGGDGSIAALWVDQRDALRVVQVGSGSGSMVCTTMGRDIHDFLRFLGIGYQEICEPDEWVEPPDASTRVGGTGLNVPYLTWLSGLGLTPPRCGGDIVPEPTLLGDDSGIDDFCRAIYGP